MFSPTDAEATYRTLYSTAPCDHHNVGANGTGCYWDGSTKGFMANESRGVRWPKSGANDTQANSIVHSMLLAAKGAGTPGMLEDVEDLIRVTQNTDKAAAFGGAGARILEKVVLGTHTPHEAIVATIKDLRSKGRRGPRHDPEDGMLLHYIFQSIFSLYFSLYSVYISVYIQCIFQSIFSVQVSRSH